MRGLFIASVVLSAVVLLQAAERFSAADLVFLTRDGCVDTRRMRASVDDALKSLGLPANYEVIDVDKLAASDRRRGYGTPTLLYRNRDLFGMKPSSSLTPS